MKYLLKCKGIKGYFAGIENGFVKIGEQLFQAKTFNTKKEIKEYLKKNNINPDYIEIIKLSEELNRIVEE